jgi:alpha-D-ribose 1-methylphosphonate 5-triphosphate diphosphatase
MKVYLCNARLVLPDRIVEDGALLIEDGHIAALNPEQPTADLHLDLHGQYLLPGLVDLHCDAIERDVEPRPNVFFPLDFAVANADRRCATHGITTAFHAISFAHNELGVRNNEMAAALVRAIHRYAPHALVDNRAHCRYEVTDYSGLPVLHGLLQEQRIHLLSLMDHTPGQGQFKTLAAYQGYLKRVYHKTDEESAALATQKLVGGAGAMERVAGLMAAAAAQGVTLATHDDDSPQRVRDMARLGARISEFPLDLATARAARTQGLVTIFGAPNLLRDESQSGTIKAADAIREGVADCICSDYVPATLLPALFRVPELCGRELPFAIRLVTANPARAAGLTDRGEIAVGLRADLIAVGQVAGIVSPSTTWVAGQRVFQTLSTR